ncbi:MAG: hypothetical protein NTY20_03810 [Candidatus Aenigmarchaeota archaeon]|nr:hypothetical protein [Candidatus Aenigmarchaeota archaeon]
MNIDYAQAMKKAFTFCLEPKRWLPFFIVDLAFLSVALALIMANSLFFIYLIAGIQDITLFGNAAVFFLELLILCIAWLLVGLWISGAVIHQSYKEREFGKSWKVSRKRYFSLLGVAAVTAIIAFIVAVIPAVGWIISIFVGLVFFFAMQSVIVKENGFMNALEDSWKIFKHQPFKVFLMWILIAVLSLIILAIFSIPLLALIFRMVIDISVGGQVTAATLMSLIYTIENQLPLLVISGIIFVLGMAISRVFSLKAQTEFYLQLKKK